jgi:uncharacterized protein YbcI
VLPINRVPEAHPRGGELNAAVARAVVRHRAEQVGCGPNKSKAFYNGNVIVVVLEDVMTRAERSLVAAGRADAVLFGRQALEDEFRLHLSSIIERLTGRTVLAFMSASNFDPDLVADLFVLDGPI